MVPSGHLRRSRRPWALGKAWCSTTTGGSSWGDALGLAWHHAGEHERGHREPGIAVAGDEDIGRDDAGAQGGVPTHDQALRERGRLTSQTESRSRVSKVYE
jgi:hypothetical protein